MSTLPLIEKTILVYKKQKSKARRKYYSVMTFTTIFGLAVTAYVWFLFDLFKAIYSPKVLFISALVISLILVLCAIRILARERELFRRIIYKLDYAIRQAQMENTLRNERLQ